MEIFSDGTRYRKICYSSVIPVRRSLSVEILLFGRWLMVVPSIDHGNSVPNTRVGGHFRACQSSATGAAHLSLYTIVMYAAKYLYFSSLGGSMP